MLKDLRHAVRMLLHAKGWTAVVVALAGARHRRQHGALQRRQRPAADEDPGRGPGLAGAAPLGAAATTWSTSSSDYGFSSKARDGQNVRTTFSYPMFQQFVADNQTMTDLFACAPFGRVNVVVDGQAEIATAFISTGNYYQVLGVSARLGRTIVPGRRPADGAAGRGDQLEVLALALRRPTRPSSARPSGSTTSPSRSSASSRRSSPACSSRSREAPDIAPAARARPAARHRPTPTAARGWRQPTYWWLQVMGRLKPGATAAQVQGNLEGVFQHTARAGLDCYLNGADRRRARRRRATATGRRCRTCASTPARAASTTSTRPTARGRRSSASWSRWCC